MRRLNHTRDTAGRLTIMQILFNGERREVTPGMTVSELLQSLGLLARHVAVEVNLELVPRARHADRVLSDGDELEVVTLVGGG